MEYLEPFHYAYMQNAILISALVGAVCALLSAFLMLKGWALIGDALSHAIVPGVAIAAILGLPFSLGAGVAAGLASFSMVFLHQRTPLKQDAVIGLIYICYFALGLFLVSLFPLMVDIQTIMMGNILAITPEDSIQLIGIAVVTFGVVILKWRDFVLVFFHEQYAQSVGIRPFSLKILFFALLSMTTVAAMQTVGAFLVVAMVIIPGATAYLWCDRFSHLLSLSFFIGMISGGLGAYLSYFLDGATGGVIVLLQSVVFALSFLFAPKYGLLQARWKRIRTVKEV